MMLPREWLKRIYQLEVKTRLMSQQLLSGNYASIFLGRGMDFDDVRPYQPGDDVRRIDWNVTARMRATYVKRFTEEREITFVILVDLSASGQYSTQEKSKLELAAELAGTLAFSASKSNDRIALLAFTDEVELYIPPGKGTDHVMHMLRTILFHKPKSTGTNLDNALRYLNRVQTRPAMVFLISDFQDQGYERTLSMTNQQHSVAAFVIQDAGELSMPKAGRMVLHDPETGEQVVVNTSDPKVQRAYAKAVAEQIETRTRILRHAGVKHMLVDSAESYVSRLAHFLSAELTRKIV